MVFSSISFLFYFLTGLFICYFLVPARFRVARNYILLAFSMLFYSCAGLRAVPLILGSTFMDYLVGLGMRRRTTRKPLLAIGIVGHVALLFWFKYLMFTLNSINALGLSLPVPEIVLPIGISFFTFQGMSYLMDVYREEVPAETSFARLLLYISLFPQLIAGPIVRYSTVADEILHRHETVDDCAQGACRFLVGLGKKVLLSNALAQIADAAFALSPDSLSVCFAWLGILAYTAHIYFDFSGYSDMAIGLGRIFGFHFLENFNYPYISRSITEFWRRWHISLSSWFKDYLYIPLGGSRKGPSRTILNLFIIWAVTGLWHGAAWNFLLWGLYFFALLMCEKFFWNNALQKFPRPLLHLYALFFIVLGWVWFRAPDLGAAVGYFSSLFGLAGNPLTEPQLGYWLRQYWPELVITPFACTPVLARIKKCFREDSLSLLLLSRGSALLLGGLSLCRLLSSSFNPFIYFRF